MGEYPSLYRGVVESNIDPENMGRCKIRVPFIHGDLQYSVDALPWSRPIVPLPVRKGRGSVVLPDVGDIVWVFFEGAEKDCPVYIGGTYARGELTTDPNLVVLYTENGDKIEYDRSQRVYQVSIGDTTLLVGNGGVQIIGNASFSGNVSISGTLTVGNLHITGSCNKECDCIE